MFLQAEETEIHCEVNISEKVILREINVISDVLFDITQGSLTISTFCKGKVCANVDI